MSEWAGVNEGDAGEKELRMVGRETEYTWRGIREKGLNESELV